MAGRDGDVQGLVEEMVQRVRVQWGAARPRHHHEVQPAGRQAVQQRCGQALLARDAHTGVTGVEGGQRLRDERRVGGGERPEPQPSARCRAQLRQLARGAPQRPGHGLGVRDEGPAGLGEPHPPRQPVEERSAAEGRLQRGDLPGDRGLGPAQRPRGHRERAVPGDLQEHPQPDGGQLGQPGLVMRSQHASDARHSLVASRAGS